MSRDSYECTLSNELKEKARIDLNEEDEKRDKDIEALRERLQNNKELHCRTDSAFLLMFLRACRFQLDDTYNVILTYFTMRAENPDVFGDLRPSTLSDVWRSGVAQVLPKRDKLGRKIIYMRPGKWDPSQFQMMDIFKANVINMESCAQDEETQVNGLVIINNLEGFGFKQVRHIQRQFFQLTSSYMQEAIPARMEAFHIVNQPRVFQYVFKLVRPLLKNELVSKMQFHGPDLEGLRTAEGLSTEVLPAELGGTLATGDELAKEHKDHILTFEEHFADQQKFNIKLPS